MVLLVAVGLVWAYWCLCALYLLVLAVGAAVCRRRPRRLVGSERRFALLVPAHDEALLIGEVVEGLRRLDYPGDLRAVIVIADNCSDATATAAREHGAEVLERTDPARRGKGFALEWAIGRVLADARRFDAVVVLDADSELSAGFLRTMDAALTEGHGAVQARYDVLNVHESWRTRLMACALALAHHVKPLGRQRLGLADGLKGNGMCFAREVLERVPWSGESVTEDIEYTLRLAEAGIRVEYAPDAEVRAQMPTTARQASTQRQRWEGGRYALMGRAARLLVRGVRGRDALLADRAADLLVPPFAEFLAVPCALIVLGAALALSGIDASGGRVLAAAWGAVLAAAVMYLVVGLFVARVPAAVAWALAAAPVYAVWKLATCAALLARGGTGGWRRTERRAFREGGPGR
ncbi:MAG: glycosyltransferase [Chthonomonadales bacterium]|nr:glycosyltransferase [Chthonomonadales bacterium]